ncbi:hypothetical protein SH580_16170 [Coraliomargarita algicola]|uniref:Transmembrane anti-sigma factor n=1 Tax=Coraliomargarita algicola TaxID=3092156 RepID=A0ABZ0RFL1_9BACT|nr:hypothetical protein [Coraliomargarita sp. J2-16]WPJ94965.1 hypothetical protein SH580_16170 [Coraliomargarita sp. J2-16]
MTEEKFTELVNLYLDKEISERGLADLKAELAVNAKRKAAFQERCRLHQAMRLALQPQAAKHRSSSSRSSGRASSRSGASLSRSREARAGGLRHASRQSSSHSSHRSVEFSARVEKGSATEKVHFSRWIIGTGLAASFAIGVTLLVPVFRDSTHIASQPPLKGVNANELAEVDPLDTIGRSELRRFATTQDQRASNHRASIAAQLRLMGLRPEHTPEVKRLRPVSLAAAQRPTPTRNSAELLAGVQQMLPMPTPQILRVEAESTQYEPGSRWPSGFHSSLASFK